jgi:tol-pal system protein YbgF
MKTLKIFHHLIFTIVLIVIVASCNATPQPDVSTENNPEESSSTTKTMTLGQILLKQSKELKKENDSLKKRLSVLEKNQTQDRDNHEKRLKQLNRTILLLEKNIELIKKAPQRNTVIVKDSAKSHPPKPVAKLASKNTGSHSTQNLQLTTPIEVPTSTNIQNNSTQNGIIKEIKTPDESKAIESITLVPASKNQKKSVNKNKQTKSKSLVVKKQTKSQPKESDIWFDSDLTPPKSPIILTVQPGSKRHYNQSFKIYSEKNYHNAINAFEQFLTRFPNDQDADNSQFWIGQCYYRSGNYVQAEVAFRKVLRNYQHGETQRGFKTPDAILMLGRVYGKNNKPIKSRKYYEYVVKFFPDSQSANKANIELQSMSSFQ